MHCYAKGLCLTVFRAMSFEPKSIIQQLINKTSIQHKREEGMFIDSFTIIVANSLTIGLEC